MNTPLDCTRNQLPVLSVVEIWVTPSTETLPVKTHEENSKNSKTQNPHILGVSMNPRGVPSRKKRKKKICGFGQSRIPAQTASRSFRKMDDSFKYACCFDEFAAWKSLSGYVSKERRGDALHLTHSLRSLEHNSVNSQVHECMSERLSRETERIV